MLQRKFHPHLSFNNPNVVFWLALIFVCVASVVMLWPTHHFQASLSQGDHGRDLYAFWQTAQGQQPYRDYWWAYGPFMPYYYALFIKLLGPGGASVLIGQMMIKIMCTLVFFGCLVSYFHPLIAATGALWFLAFNPLISYTFNHVGATLFVLLGFLGLIRYIQSPSYKKVGVVFLSAAAVTLIKVNTGLAMFICYPCFLINHRLLTFKKEKMLSVWKLILIGALSFGITIGIYALFLFSLDQARLMQVLPLRPSYYPQAYIRQPIQHLISMWISQIKTSPANGIYGAFVFLSFFNFIWMWFKYKERRDFLLKIFLVLLSLSLGLLFLLHEYLLTGHYYRLYWIGPLIMLIHFFLLATTLKYLPRSINRIFALCLILIACLSTVEERRVIRTYQVPNQYLTGPLAEISVGNSFAWVSTVNQTILFLKEKLNRNETFLAIPYDPLYYYLLEKQSPIWETVFFEFFHLSDQQQNTIIRQLEDQNIRYVLMSSGMRSRSPGIGIFGKTHCQILGAYLKKHYRPITMFGDWSVPPAKSWDHHGTMILELIK